MAHQDFVRQLACSLVRDTNSAADIAQETWLAALKRPPESSRSIKGWLSTVTRNVSRMLNRGESRRVKREMSAARPEFVHSTEEVVEREEIRAKVVDAVLRLKEPYRSATLLRYYQDLTPKEISDRFEVPLPTVNSRLRRGLEQLREEIDAQYNGDRKSWLAALAPIAGMNVGAPASAAAGSVATFLGMLIMSAKIKVGAACVFVLGAALTLGSYLQETASPLQQTVEMDSTIQSYSPTHRPEETETPDKKKRTRSTADIRQKIIPASSGINLSGRVTDKVTKKPVTAFYARLTWKDEEEEYHFIDDTIRNENGYFSFSLDQGGKYGLSIRSSRYPRQDLKNLVIPEITGLDNLHIELDPCQSVSGYVVDDATGAPIENVLVGAWFTTKLASIFFRSPEASIHTYSNDRGYFTLHGLGKCWEKYSKKHLEAHGPHWWLFGVHPEFSVGGMEAFPDNPEVVIRLKKGPRIFGRVLDTNGNPMSGVMISVYAQPFKNPNSRIKNWLGPETSRPVLTDIDGSYCTPPLIPGSIRINAVPPLDQTEETFNFLSETKVVELIDRNLEVNFNVMEEYVTWRGILYDPFGVPIEHGNIRARPVSMTSDLVTQPFPRSSSCNAQGLFKVRKIVPGKYKVSVKPLGMQARDIGKIQFEKPGLIEQDIHMSGGEINGYLIDKATELSLVHEKSHVGATKVHIGRSGITYSTEHVPNGKFRLRGLAPGNYILYADVPGYVDARIRNVEVREGQCVENLQVVLHRGGRLYCNCDGYTDATRIMVIISRFANDPEPEVSWLLYRDEKGFHENTIDLDPGTWEVACSVSGQDRDSGVVYRNVLINTGQTTELTFHKEDFDPYEGEITLDGRILYTDGSHLESARITMNASGIPGLDKKTRTKRIIPDASGHFTVSGLKPGKWILNIKTLNNGGHAMVREVVIPADPPNPYFYDITLPKGIVRGKIKFPPHNFILPISFRFHWEVYLQNMDTGRKVGRFCNGWYGSANEFIMIGIPPGRYRIAAEGDFFKLYLSSPFHLKEGELLDYGAVDLAFGSSVIFNCKDTTGKSISAYVQLPDQDQVGFQWSYEDYISLGHRAYHRLPEGKVRFRIKSKGYRDKEIYVDVLKDAVKIVDVVLEPE